MPYSIAQAAAKLGVHPTTIRRQIRSGKLPAKMVDGQWIIHDDTIAQATDQSNRPKQGTLDGDGGAYQAILAVLEHQLEEKDRQIRELHVLLQSAQEQTQRMISKPTPRWLPRWWPF